MKINKMLVTGIALWVVWAALTLVHFGNDYIAIGMKERILSLASDMLFLMLGYLACKKAHQKVLCGHDLYNKDTGPM